MRPIGLARCAPRLRQLMKGAIFFMAQPPLLREGEVFAYPTFISQFGHRYYAGPDC